MSVPPAEQERLKTLAREADLALSDADAPTVVRWAVEEFGERVCVASSMADTALTHLASQARQGIEVIFLDTGYHFAETIGVRDAVAAFLPVAVRTVQPRQTVAEQDAEYGPRLYERDPDRCCALRKVAPMEQALRPYHAWMTGLRRDTASSRRQLHRVEWDSRFQLVKVNPLANWTLEDLRNYLHANNLVVNPLLMDGYPSIGCAPCTRRVSSDEEQRAGRWAGKPKTECGLHAPNDDQTT